MSENSEASSVTNDIDKNEPPAEKVEETSVNESEPPPRTDKSKIDILLKATGNAPIMKQKKWSVEPEKQIGSIILFIKKYLGLNSSEGLFLYVNQAFAPAPDQAVKNLFECYGTNGKLVLHYCKSQAWG